jgi:hypothetical protein
VLEKYSAERGVRGRSWRGDGGGYRSESTDQRGRGSRGATCVVVPSCGGGIAVRSDGTGGSGTQDRDFDEATRQEGKKHMGYLVGWASPLLTRLLSFSFFFFPFFFIYCSKLLFLFFN